MHSEYRRIAAGTDKAILFVHGILGTSGHFYYEKEDWEALMKAFSDFLETL